MPFLEVQFPVDVAMGLVGGPVYLTNIVTVESGHEFRDQIWKYPRHRYVASRDADRPEEFERVLAFFHEMRGSFYGFRVKDWSDYRATATVINGQQGILGETGFGDGAAEVFQAYKRYGTTQPQLRVIRKLRSIAVYINGVVAATPADYTVNLNTGVVTLNATPTEEDTVTWSGEFDVPCRFDTDEMQSQIINRSVARGLLHTWQSIQLLEVRS